MALTANFVEEESPTYTSGTVPVKKVPLSTYTITSSTGSGGTIDPLGEVAVGEGGDQTFTITHHKARATDR